jgi:ABC-2 type transport system ATP-binding protein
MKVLDRLYFLAAIKEVSRDQAKERIGEWLDKMELRPWLNKKVDELSKGMAEGQFIATIVHDPEILILDEVFSGSTRSTRPSSRITSEFRSRGKTMSLPTHVLEQAEKLCDEICLVAKSKKILEGNLKDLKKRYAGDLLRLSVQASESEVGALAGVVSVQPLNGEYVVALQPGTDRREFLRRVFDRYDVKAFSEKEPELEEIYLTAVKKAGIEDTRTIE